MSNNEKLIKRIRSAAAKASAALLKQGPSSAGALQKSKRQPFDIPAISADEVAEARTFFPMDKFFIFGHARSGTTLLTRLVRVHPQVYCNYQGHFFTRQPLLHSLVSDPEVSEWLSRRSNRWNRGRDLSPVILRAAADFILERDARKAGKIITGDKSPNSLLDGDAVRLLTRIYPDARLIFIVRDGRDAAISHRFQAFIDIPQSLTKEDLHIRQQYVSDPEPFLNGQRSIFTEKGLRTAATGWVKNVVETNRVALDLLPDAYLHLRYEELLENPKEQMGQTWSFLGADLNIPGLWDALNEELKQNPDAEWQQKKANSEVFFREVLGADKAKQPSAGTGEKQLWVQPKGKAGSWQKLLTEHDRQLYWEIAGATLSTWGYTE